MFISPPSKNCKKKPQLSNKDIAAHLQFGKDHMDKLKGYWKKKLWMDDTKIEVVSLNVPFLLLYC